MVRASQVSSSSSTLTNFIRGDSSLISSPSADELRSPRLALATRDLASGGSEVVGAAVISVIQMSRHDSTLFGVSVILFGVRKELQRRGIGSKLECRCS